MLTLSSQIYSSPESAAKTGQIKWGKHLTKNTSHLDSWYDSKLGLYWSTNTFCSRKTKPFVGQSVSPDTHEGGWVWRKGPALSATLLCSNLGDTESHVGHQGLLLRSPGCQQRPANVQTQVSALTASYSSPDLQPQPTQNLSGSLCVLQTKPKPKTA